MAIITLENLQFSYNSQPVLAGLFHRFAENSFTAVLGTNGCGKSTLLKLITGILNPSAGAIFIYDQKVANIERRQLSRVIAYVQQSQTLAFSTTVFDTILAGRNPYMGWKPSQKDKQIVFEILANLKLKDLALKDINQLSGGQRQRVFLARALAQETPIIILDEPTSNLDPRHQAETLSLLKNISLSGKTIIMALHDINLAAKYCTHFIMLKNRNLLSHGFLSAMTTDLLEELYEVEIGKIQIKNRNYFII